MRFISEFHRLSVGEEILVSRYVLDKDGQSFAEFIPFIIFLLVILKIMQPVLGFE